VETLARHDLVIAVGGPLNLYHTEGHGPHLPKDTKVWLITDDPGLLSFAPGDRAVLADPRHAVETLARLALRHPRGSRWSRVIRAVRPMPSTAGLAKTI
jgi:benzoylformate decarboxylase